MEKLRLLSYQTVDVEFVIPDEYESNEEFTATITDMADFSTSTTTGSGTAADTITISLSGKYDNDYRIEIVDESGTTVHDETYALRRPYVNPNTLGETASEIAAVTANEEIARAMIDAVIPEGFYYSKSVVETSGLGSDYIPLWTNAKKVLKVYENNVLIYDAADAASYDVAFEITKDKTAIVRTTTDVVNRKEGATLVLPAGSSDYADSGYRIFGTFPNGYDYRFVLETGYSSVPSDITRAATLLVDDLACGKLDYYKRYVSDYNTDQYRLKFDAKVFNGTGNIIVDKILSKYSKSIRKLGVL